MPMLLQATLLLCLFLVTGVSMEENKESRRYVNLPSHGPQLPFSDAVLVGNTMYLSGRIGLDPKTGKPPAAIEDETRLLLDGVKATLEQGGMTMDDLVSVQIFCPDVSLWEKVNGVYRGYFGKELPARAFVGSGPLLLGGHFELVAIAVKR